MEFSKKYSELRQIMAAISRQAGGCGDRTSGKCTTCPRTFDWRKEFDSDLSFKEYKISGMCQPCQKSVFG